MKRVHDSRNNFVINGFITSKPNEKDYLKLNLRNLKTAGA